MQGIKWIFFDVGGTLVDETESFRRRVLRTIEIQKSLGNRYTVEELECAMKHAARSGSSYFRGAMKTMGISEFAPYDCIGEKLYPEAKAVLTELAKMYRLGIIANQPEGTERRMHAYGIGHLFSLVLSSAEEGMEKPDSALFLRALAKAGCEASASCMIGDRPDNDIAPAKALGMHTVRITQGLGGMMPVQNETMRADATVSNLCELLSVFEINFLF